MKLKSPSRLLPTWQKALLAVLSALLLILAFPPFEWSFAAWFALLPLLWAVQRERAVGSSFTLGWLFGNIFFFGTCWWLTFAPITYAGFPLLLAYFLLFCVSSVASIFPGVCAAIVGYTLARFGSVGILVVPFAWVFSEFARYWITGNNWNAIGYSQAFSGRSALASYGGVFLTSFVVVIAQTLFIAFPLIFPKLTGSGNFAVAYNAYHSWITGTPADSRSAEVIAGKPVSHSISLYFNLFRVARLLILFAVAWLASEVPLPGSSNLTSQYPVIAIQPNVPMAGLTLEKWRELRRRHVQLAEFALNRQDQSLAADNRPPTTVVFPESPMNFQYDDDPETREFINNFAAKYNVSVLFNSAEPDKENNKYFNSAVLVGPDGREIGQYDKIYLLPFGEAVPVPLDSIVPAFVGSFSYGKEYDLLPIGDAKAGVMICFESHFGQLSAEYVRNGADVLIEMTNDGYLGPTPVLRQHLANAVFRAVETNRPVLRVTNVGITAYINERGEVLDPAESYVEDTRVWSVGKSDGKQTFYVKYGDWFAWLCTVITLSLIVLGILRRKTSDRNSE